MLYPTRSRCTRRTNYGIDTGGLTYLNKFQSVLLQCVVAFAIAYGAPDIALGAEPTWVQDIEKKYLKSVVRISAVDHSDGDREVWSAFGFIVSARGYVITAAHAVPPADLCGLRPETSPAGCPTRRLPDSDYYNPKYNLGIVGTIQGKRAPMEIVYSDLQWDVALLKFHEDPSPNAPNFSSLALPIGDSDEIDKSVEVVALTESTTDWGNIIDFNGRRGRWITAIDFNPGYSGAPVFDSKFRRVIGIVHGARKRDNLDQIVQGQNYITPINFARHLLEVAGVHLSARVVKLEATTSELARTTLWTFLLTNNELQFRYRLLDKAAERLKDVSSTFFITFAMDGAATAKYEKGYVVELSPLVGVVDRNQGLGAFGVSNIEGMAMKWACTELRRANEDGYSDAKILHMDNLRVELFLPNGAPAWQFNIDQFEMQEDQIRARLTSSNCQQIG